MPRRILLLITDLELGGLPTVVRELAVRLHGLRSARVEVACLSRWGPVADQIRAAGVRVTALGAARARDLGAIVRLVRRVRGGRFDTVFSFLVHANVAAAAAAVAVRFLPGPRVRFLQCIQTTQPRPRWHWWAQGAAQAAAEKVVACSESVAAALRDWSRVPARKIVTIPNAVDPAAFPASPAPATEERPYPIGFIGRLDPIKRLPDLLEAVRLLDGLVRLTIYGAGEERGTLAEQIARLGLGGLVTLQGPIPRAQEALARVGLLVLPSEAEGFGIVLIEAMAARVPVVATDVPGIRDVVRPGRTGLLVPPRSPEALAGAIRRVVDDRALRRALIQEAADDVARRFTWDRVIERYKELLTLE